MATRQDDAELVAAAAAGDQQAFAELYHRYRGAVHGVALARLPPSDAGDLVQDVFTRALAKLSSLKKPGSFRSWILMIARNRAMDFYRERKATDDDPDTLAATSPPVAEARRVLAVIQALPDAYRETLIMRLVEGMTGPEIAERTGLTPDSVRVNLHRGMKLLRQRLGMEETS